MAVPFQRVSPASGLAILAEHIFERPSLISDQVSIPFRACSQDLPTPCFQAAHQLWLRSLVDCRHDRHELVLEFLVLPFVKDRNSKVKATMEIGVRDVT
jgi:hypothetical protein